METLTLEAEIRTNLGRQAKMVRAQGKIPAVVYGTGVASQSLSVDARAFHKIFAQAGESALVQLQIAGSEPMNVLIQEIEVEPVSNRIGHIDFRAVSLTQKISADVSLIFNAAAPAVKELGGTLVKQRTTLRVSALPQDLVHEIEIDTSSLKTFEDALRVKDITLPPGLTAEAPAEEIVAMVAAPRTEEELKAMEAKPDEKVAEVKVITEEKKKERDAAKAATTEEKK